MIGDLRAPLGERPRPGARGRQIAAVYEQRLRDARQLEPLDVQVREARDAGGRKRKSVHLHGAIRRCHDRYPAGGGFSRFRGQLGSARLAQVLAAAQYRSDERQRIDLTLPRGEHRQQCAQAKTEQTDPCDAGPPAQLRHGIDDVPRPDLDLVGACIDLVGITGAEIVETQHRDAELGGPAGKRAHAAVAAQGLESEGFAENQPPGRGDRSRGAM